MEGYRLSPCRAARSGHKLRRPDRSASEGRTIDQMSGVTLGDGEVRYYAASEWIGKPTARWALGSARRSR